MEKTINTYEVKKESSLAKLVKCISQFKIKIIIGVIFSALASILRLASPLIIGAISKNILDASKVHTGAWPAEVTTKILILSCIAFGAYGLSFVFDLIQVYFITGVTSDTNKTLRNRMANKINTLPLNYFDTRNIGDILSYVTNDVDLIGLTLNNTLSNLISAAITLVGSIIILFILNPYLGLIALIALPLALIVMSIIGKKAEKSFKNRQDLTSEISSQAEESYTAYYIVKSFNATEMFKNNFANSNLKLEKANFKSDSLAGLMTPMMIFFGNLVFAAICLVGGYIAGKAGGRTEEIVMVVTAVSYGEQLISPLSNIANLLATFQQALAATSRVYSMLEQTDEPDETSKTTKLDKIKGNVGFDHVRFGYTKDRVIIHDFSQNAKSGQKIAIVGPTGAGKTTMVNLLMRFYEINGGKITIEGVDTTKMNRSYVRGLFGMVLQDTWLFEGSFMENLKFSRRDATDEEVIAACKATHCHEFIMQQAGGYNKILKEDCGLSSGQKQLLTIARAMVQNAPMLILDEATSSVDTRTELLIQDAMDKLMKGRTSFVIAHRLSTIKNANLIIVMKDGDVVECGDHNQLLKKKGLYADLYNSQFANKRN